MDMDNNDIGRKAFSLFLGETEIINSKDADRYFVIGNGNVQLVKLKPSMVLEMPHIWKMRPVQAKSERETAGHQKA